MEDEQEVTGQSAVSAESAPQTTASPEAHQTSKIEASALNRVLNVDLELRVELARVNLPIREILDLSSGSVVDLKKAVGEPVDLFVNDKPLAKGEVVVVEDLLGIRITEIVSPNNPGDAD